MRILLAFALACAALTARAQTQEVPEWFGESFLEFPQDVTEAAQEGKRLMLYFWQPGCPSCRKMKDTTFADPAVVDETRRRFVPVALSVFGERELQWTDGRRLREKALARELKIRGTPTLVFLDEKGAVVLRQVGYVAPRGFAALLEQARGR